jgi:hypothetical protein
MPATSQVIADRQRCSQQQRMRSLNRTSTHRHKPRACRESAIETRIIQELKSVERPKEKHSVNTPKGVRYTLYESSVGAL